MKRALLAFLILSLLSPVEAAQRQPNEIDWQKAGDEAVELLARYLRVDTTNPPGNEARATEFFAKILERERIEHRVFVSAPGRANLYARIKGNGRKRAVILLNHTDVVPADKRFWSADPLSGALVDGYLYGRGALDMKSLGAVQFMTLVLLKRAGVVLDRDVIFLATADEEAGGREGAGWFVRNHPELVKDAEFLLTEGSSNAVVGRDVIFYGIGTTEKTPCWLRLTAKGTPGHGSVPKEDSAPSRMLRALGKIEAYETQLVITEAVARYFRSIAQFQNGADSRRAYSDIKSAVSDPRLREMVLANPYNAALLRNTIQPTVVQIGSKTNVIDPIAVAELDCRLLPGQRPQDFVAEIKRVINDPSIQVETVLAFAATESPLETELYRAISDTILAEDRKAQFVPTVLAGFTDSHFFRDLGITCYGFSPFLIPGEDASGVHGNNERISAETVRKGTRLHYKIVHALAGAKGREKE